MHHGLRRLAFATVLGFGSPLAMAWGPEGHALIADIAQSHLSPTAAAQVERLLKLEGYARLDQISSWADGNRKEFPQTGSWHYVDIPLSAPHYDAARDCARNDCVVAKISQYTKVLANRSARPAERLLALKWVVHFVGDIHQPLHAEDNGDKGGNMVQLRWYGRGTNLHSIWDSRIIQKQLDLHSGPNFSFDHVAVAADAKRLDSQISGAERTAWAPLGLLPRLDSVAVSWAEESHTLAREVAYANLPKSPRGHWADAYQRKAWPVVKSRLQQGGVRLAALLNEALSGE